jgi:hypothetical protein
LHDFEESGYICPGRDFCFDAVDEDLQVGPLRFLLDGQISLPPSFSVNLLAGYAFGFLREFSALFGIASEGMKYKAMSEYVSYQRFECFAIFPDASHICPVNSIAPSPVLTAGASPHVWLPSAMSSGRMERSAELVAGSRRSLLTLKGCPTSPANRSWTIEFTTKPTKSRKGQVVNHRPTC